MMQLKKNIIEFLLVILTFGGAVLIPLNLNSEPLGPRYSDITHKII
jgi:hypothetical protein